MLSEILHASGVLELVVDNPPVNAYGVRLLKLLAESFESIAGRSDVRAVLLRAAGSGFCGGGDLKEMKSLKGFEGILAHGVGSLRLSLAMTNCVAPVICAIQNYCVGIGVLVAGSADVLVASAATRFVLAEVDNGATAGGVLALKLMPEKRARAAMMTAEAVLAEELLSYGSIYQVVDLEALAPAAHRLADVVAAKNPNVMRRLKRSLNGSSNAAALEALYRAELSYTYELNMMGDADAGRSAFLTGDRDGYLPR